VGRNPKEVWAELVELAEKYSKGVLGLGPELLASKYQEYLDSLPDFARDGAIVIFDPEGKKSRVVPRREVPRLLREDPEFRELYIKMLLGVR